MDASGTPTRRKSGRGPKKARGQRESLGVPQSSSQENKSFHLVVCGATNHKHGFIFSDFMGFCLALKEHGVAGDFYSCFPLQEHFIWLKNQFSPPIDVIKFGKLGPDKSKSLYTYSRHTYLNREYWWTQVGTHELLDKVQAWIAEKQQQAKSGDVVNIILEGHGDQNGNYHLGDKWIHSYVFRDLLAGFAKGVQVNAISGACYSGNFLDAIKSSSQRDRYFTAPGDEKAFSTTRSVSNRIRNSRFSQAFVQSLAKVTLPGVARRQVTWRLKDHENFMKTQLMRNLTPGGIPVEPQFYASEPIDGMTLVEDIIFRDMIDIAYDPCISARRRRIEWPTMDPNVRDHLIHDDNIPSQVSPAAKAVNDSEISKCDTRRGMIDELDIYDQFYIQHPNWRQVLRALYWRARRQSTIWDVFELLWNRGFLHPQCLTVPNKVPLQGTGWNTDIQWLATMIVRSGAELDKLLDTIEASGFLGRCIPERLALFKDKHREPISQNPRDREGVLRADGSVDPKYNVFGFWLPHGLDGQNPDRFASQLRRCKQRFNLIEEVFREVEGIPQNQLWLESEQAEFFERHPDQLPGGENDHPDIREIWDDSSAGGIFST